MRFGCVLHYNVFCGIDLVLFCIQTKIGSPENSEANNRIRKSLFVIAVLLTFDRVLVHDENNKIIHPINSDAILLKPIGRCYPLSADIEEILAAN